MSAICRLWRGGGKYEDLRNRVMQPEITAGHGPLNNYKLIVFRVNYLSNKRLMQWEKEKKGLEQKLKFS